MDLIFDYLQSGGGVSFPLVGLFLIIAYTSSYRFLLLYGGRKISMRSLFQDPSLGRKSIQQEFFRELLSSYDLCKERGVDLREAMDSLVLSFDQEIRRYSGILNTAVVLAPLLGLLGTVTGMIETFSSLSSGSLFSHSGGIAGGISQALVTTQLGLVVAIPGIFLSRYIKKIERKTHSDFLQLCELLMHKYRKEVLP